ncbi:hypothetical protein EN809_025435 [Mesorhizobium sp. M2E.F.Ca.ET.166.01.1.1]|nr:hypothetical protein EN862_014170 [Mesorhizobium sp. M2E.F.Ca.ET.219.01.1.1]TGT67882.1 hypothetical protein EN809_025435 [Mesorhizobium sp. M2E.F.Ca.ET.166.01.1.1]TGW00883.1 hypothetical protein EN797_010745 [Mesorhizobium sp. M2E.F.Ca.ET.154.01.1.1]
MRFRFFDFTHVFIPKPVLTFERHALGPRRNRRTQRALFSELLQLLLSISLRASSNCAPLVLPASNF